MAGALKRLVSIDFRIVSAEEAVVPVMDRGFLYGDSVYEVVRTYHRTKVFLLDRHYQRLLHSAEQLHIQVPFSISELSDHLAECMSKTDHPDHYIRMIVSRGEDERFDLAPSESPKLKTVVLVDHIKKFPAEYYEVGVPVALVSIRRNLRTALDPNIKSGNYLNNVMAMQEAKKRGAADAVMLNVKDEVAEATASNVFAVRDGVVLTPPLESGILGGISRGLLKEVLEKHRVPFEERPIPKEEFLSSDELFLTGTIKEIMPVSQIDGKKVGSGEPGPVTRNLMKLWREEVGRRLDHV